MTRIALITMSVLSLAACAPEAEENDLDLSGNEAEEASGVAPATMESREAAQAVVHAFHRALSEADSTAALELLHPEAVIYESGHAETVEEYRGGHLPADIRFAAATEREILSERTVDSGGNALYLAETRVRGSMGDREVDSRGVETVVLAPEGEGWLIRHIHWSSR